MYIDIDKIRLNYTIKGEGKPVILLHGWGGSINSLHDLQLLLSKDFQVFNMDLPGFGESSIPDSAWGSAEYANFIAKFIKQFNIQEPILVGHSNGGRISARFAINYPDLLRGIVLVDSSGIKPVMSGKKQLVSNLSQTGKALFSNPLFAPFEPLVRRTFYKSIGETDYLNSGEMKEVFMKLIAEDIEPELTKINLPTLILWGKADDQTPLWMGERFHEKILNSKFIVIDDARHGLPLKCPEIVKTKILEWVNELA